MIHDCKYKIIEQLEVKETSFWTGNARRIRIVILQCEKCGYVIHREMYLGDWEDDFS